MDGGAHRAVRRGDPEGLRRGADLPDRARRGRRRDGRVRLRRDLRAGVRDRRGRLLLHGGLRRASPRACSQGFCLRVVASGLYGHVLYTGLVGMAIGVSSPVGPRSRCGTGSAVAAGLCALAVARALPVELAPARPVPGGTMDGHGLRCSSPFATAIKGLPLARVRRDRGHRWRAGGSAGGSTPRSATRSGSTASRPRSSACSRARAAARRSSRRCGGEPGARAASLLHRLQREQVNLAMVASRVGRRRRPGAAAPARATAGRSATRSQAIPGAAPAETGDDAAAG